jgi:hypothetical protein
LTANGFLTSTPETRYGTSPLSSGANRFSTQKFTCGGSGAEQINEIGIWAGGDGNNAGLFHLCLMTDDSANGCPEGIVEHSDSGELTTATSSSIVKNNFVYSSLPSVTGGVDYWIVWGAKDTYGRIDYKLGTGLSTIYMAGTYPTFPTGAEWHTHTHAATIDIGFYAVYQAATDKSWSGSGTLTESGVLTRTANLGRSYGGAL